MASWSSAAGWQMAGGVPEPAGHRCQPRVRDARRREAGGQAALPSGASETAEVETWLRPSARWPKGLHRHKGGSVLEVVHSSYSQPGRGWAEEMCCSFPGLCLHPCAGALRAPLQCFSDSSRLLGVLRPMVERVSCSP